MSIALTVNGATFEYPTQGNKNWGSVASSWAAAVTSGMLQKAGGTFTLTAEVDFGANFGLKSIYYKSRSSNISDTGILRQANSDLITWRNGLNTGNNTLGVNSSNQLLYNGTPIDSSISVSDTSTINLEFILGELTAEIVDNSITNALINAAAAIEVTKLLSGTTSQVLITNGSTPTWTTLSGDGYNSATGVITNTGIRGKTLSTTLATIGSSQDGYNLTWNNGSNAWVASPVSFVGGLIQFCVRVPFTASGATGTLIDVTVWNASAPVALRIIRGEVLISTADGYGSALRTAAAGGGSVVLPNAIDPTITFSTTIAGHIFDDSTVSATVAVNGSLFYNVDRAVTGELILTCVVN